MHGAALKGQPSNTSRQASKQGHWFKTKPQRVPKQRSTAPPTSDRYLSYAADSAASASEQPMGDDDMR
jgi:hypothetical protein